ncbi:hypothetical protein RvY_08201 [Ramazzottius varieornatus]|uniref:Uncharacterized protein n=1 Tax=Ramazzottius varieornatus TaxID=947166 RepID=A0A1D1V4X8_RAMVA|nr:hypothetical protein RvY_08201 [Ramazzottius varieornatus]
MTGVSKKPNPYTGEFFMEFIQCCRVGFGPPVAHRPPVTYSGSGVPSYQVPAGGLTTAHPAYQAQYRANKEGDVDDVRKHSNLTKKTSRTERPLRPEHEKFLLLAGAIKPKNEQLTTKSFEI